MKTLLIALSLLVFSTTAVFADDAAVPTGDAAGTPGAADQVKPTEPATADAGAEREPARRKKHKKKHRRHHRRHR